MTPLEIDKVHSLLWHKGYRQMWILKPSRNAYSSMQGEIRVHSNAIMVNPNVKEIKGLLGDNFHVDGDTNSEIITIK